MEKHHKAATSPYPEDISLFDNCKVTKKRKKKAQTERDESMKPFHTDECQSISMESWLGWAFPKVFQLQEHMEELQDSTDVSKRCAVRS